MTDNVVIRMEHGWKRYGTNLTAELKRLWRKSPVRPDEGGHWVLRDLNFELRQGEVLGVIGRNGAGKSTLLKILAGVSPLTSGRFVVRGRMFPMIELNAGMHMDLTGRQNVHLLGAIMGFTPQDIQKRLPEIEEFCELEEYFDRPVWTYSSGMIARLGFAVAVNVDAEILLIDEVLAVGDFAFQKKCLDRVNVLTRQGATIILVSHNPYAIERMCDKALLLHQGEVVQQGDPNNIARSYFEMINEIAVGNVKSPTETVLNREGTGQLRVVKVQILDKNGYETEQIQTGDAVTFRLHLRVYEAVLEPAINIRIFDANNTMITALSMTFERQGIIFKEDDWVDCHIPKIPFMPNVYYLQIKITVGVLVDMINNALTLKVTAPPEIILKTDNKGIIFTEAQWHFYKAGLSQKASPSKINQQ